MLAATELRCSRCDRDLEEGHFMSHVVPVCPGCGGVWIAGESRARMVLELRPEPTQGGRPVASCPECAREMRAVEALGVVVELCVAHGAWLDVTFEDGMQMFLALTESPA